MRKDNNKIAFFLLVEAGLWEKDVRLSQFENIDFNEVYQLAEEQSVVGLIAVGLQHVVDIKIPQIELLTLIGRAVQLEQKNSAMNDFIGKLVEKMQIAGIYSLLVKGQGVAQCYEHPLWRSCGDIDLLLNDSNYENAYAFLSPLAQHIEREESYSHHIGMTIESWQVELHGSLRCGLSSLMDKVIDEIQKDCFYKGQVRTWENGDVYVFLPAANDDILLIFTHFLKHFYKGGLGVRQICDWCRLLWRYRSEINIEVLERRLRKMKLVSEWNAFGAFAVYYLGMPNDAMPLYSPNNKWKRKANRICSFIMEVGNFGHNRDTSYYGKYPFVVRKFISMGWRIGDLFRHARIFPLDSLRFFPKIMYDGIRSAVKGE